MAGGNKADGKHHPMAAGTITSASIKLQIASADSVTATSGACATIASDALMNPFDGANSVPSNMSGNTVLTSDSYQTADAGPRFNLPVNDRLRAISIPC